MYSISSILAQSQVATSQKLFGADGAPDDAFAKVFESILDAPATRRGKIQEALNSLSERFPNLSIQSADVPKGVEGAKEHFEVEEDPTVDAVAVSPSVLSGMFGNGNLAKMVEDAISGFLERGGGGNLMNFQGAYVQRTVTITIAEVRYGELHRSQETNEVLAADELKTNFSERLSELIAKFFGAKDEASSDAGSEDAGTGEEGSETKKTDNLPLNGNAFASMWSMELYYSSSFISSMQNLSDGSDSSSMSAMMQSWRFSASFSGMMSGISSELIPQSILGVTGVSASGGMAFGTVGYRQSSISSALETALSAFGLEASGYRVDGEGHFVGMRERRNLLSELMELYQGKLKQSTETEGDAAAETEDESAIAGVEEVAEPVAESA